MMDLVVNTIGIIVMSLLAVFLFLLSIPNEWIPISWKNEDYKNKKIIIKRKGKKYLLQYNFFYPIDSFERYVSIKLFRIHRRSWVNNLQEITIEEKFPFSSEVNDRLQIIEKVKNEFEQRKKEKKERKINKKEDKKERKINKKEDKIKKKKRKEKYITIKIK